MGACLGPGALDMKGQAIVEVMTMIAIKRRGVPLNRDVILIANADEETDSTGAEWFAQEKRRTDPGRGVSAERRREQPAGS